MFSHSYFTTHSVYNMIRCSVLFSYRRCVPLHVTHEAGSVVIVSYCRQQSFTPLYLQSTCSAEVRQYRILLKSSSDDNDDVCITWCWLFCSFVLLRGRMSLLLWNHMMRFVVVFFARDFGSSPPFWDFFVWFSIFSHAAFRQIYFSIAFIVDIQTCYQWFVIRCLCILLFSVDCA